MLGLKSLTVRIIGTVSTALTYLTHQRDKRVPIVVPDANVDLDELRSSGQS